METHLEQNCVLTMAPMSAENSFICVFADAYVFICFLLMYTLVMFPMQEENTGLHWAAFSGSLDISEVFLDMGCELDSPNEHGDRPL